MRKLIVGALVALTVPVACAQAAFLSRGRAHAKAESVAAHLCTTLSWCNDYSVELAALCPRRSSTVMDCGYTIYAEDGGICNSVIRVRLRYGHTFVAFPMHPRCH